MRARALYLGLTVVGALIASVAIPSDAIGQRVSDADASGDMQYFKSADGQPAPAPGHPNADIVRYAVHYDEHRIWLRLTLRELNHRDPLIYLSGAFQYFAGGELHYSEAYVKARARHWAGISHISNPSTCATRHHVDFVANTVMISFASSCFGNPRWLRFNAVTATMDRWKDPTYLYGDRAPGTLRDEQWTERITRG